MNLTPKQQMFVKEYLVDLNATQAAIRAGYSAKTSEQQGARLLVNVKVAAEIQKGMNKRAEKIELTSERVLKEIAHSAFLDPIELFADDGSLLPLKQMPEHARRAIAGIEVEELFAGKGDERQMIGYLKKIKLVSKEGTLTLAGKHLKLFNEVGSKENPLTVEALTDEQINERLKQLESK